jgi:xylulose-5-phosphate/fructose-6-phosphate phosphoketolase
MKSNTLAPELLEKMDAYWRAANYRPVGQIYLYDNPLLKRPWPRRRKHMLLGHWGLTPGQNIYVHLNRVIKYDLDMIYISAPGHGGPVVANTYLQGTTARSIRTSARMRPGCGSSLCSFRFRRNSQPHRRVPGSIHEGGELGYSLSHAFGRCSTIPISSSPASSAMVRRKPVRWPPRGIQQFLNPATDGAVLPILHLNGRKLQPDAAHRITAKVEQLLAAMAGRPYFVRVRPVPMHRRWPRRSTPR